MIDRKRAPKKYKEELILSAESVDRLSQLLATALTEVGTEKKDVLRIRLSLEEILGVWLKKSEGAVISYKAAQKFGRLSIEVSMNGPQICVDEDEEGFLLSNRLLAQAGLALDSSYQSGKNRLVCCPLQKPRIGQMTQLILAVVLAVVFGSITRFILSQGKITALAVTQPLFNMILGALRAVSSPLVFLAVCCGIVSIGDLSMVGKIGKKLIFRLLRGTFVLCAVVALAGVMMFGVVTKSNHALSNDFSGVYQMVLEIVPSDIVSPFLEGNALQLVFMGISIGAALLILGERTSAIQEVVRQANEVTQFLMKILGKTIPIFVFLSIFNLLLSDFDGGFLAVFKVFVLVIPACLLITLFYIFAAAIRLQVSPFLLIKKMLPTFFIALTTASSAAALATNLETCEKKLGIPPKVAEFAIPLGQVIYKPGFVVGFFPLVLCMAEYYDIAVTPLFLVMAFLTISLLSMAVPPIPGGGLSVFTVMFVQLGIPGEAIALAVAINAILDFFMTAAGLSCLQIQVVYAAHSVGMLDQEKLHRPTFLHRND